MPSLVGYNVGLCAFGDAREATVDCFCGFPPWLFFFMAANSLSFERKTRHTAANTRHRERYVCMCVESAVRNATHMAVADTFDAVRDVHHATIPVPQSV